MIKINNYLPKVLQDVTEFKIVNENLDKELTNVDKVIKNIQKEAVVQTASEYGISKWEKTLGIIPTDNESLEVRRFRINNILTSKLPYTLRWLQNKLTEIVGSASGWILNIDYSHYTITIILSGLNTNLMLEVEKQLRNAIPSNMKLEIGGPSITSSEIKIGVGMMYATKYNVNANYKIVPFDFNIGDFEEGSIGENGKINLKDAGVAVTSGYTQVYSGRKYEFGNDQEYTIYGLAFYDIYGNLIDRQTGLNISEFTVPEDIKIVRVTVMDENGIRPSDISGQYLGQV